MSKLSKFRQFFSTKEHLSVEALRTIRGGSNEKNCDQPVETTPDPWSPPVPVVPALEDNKRPERPGGGVSTH